MNNLELSANRQPKPPGQNPWRQPRRDPGRQPETATRLIAVVLASFTPAEAATLLSTLAPDAIVKHMLTRERDREIRAAADLLRIDGGSDHGASVALAAALDHFEICAWPRVRHDPGAAVCGARDVHHYLTRLLALGVRVPRTARGLLYVIQNRR